MIAGNRALGRLIKWVSALTAAVEALRDHNRDCLTRKLLTHSLALRDGQVAVSRLNPLCSQWCRRCKSLTDRIVRLHATPTRRPRAKGCEDCVVCLESIVSRDERWTCSVCQHVEIAALAVPPLTTPDAWQAFRSRLLYSLQRSASAA